MHNVETSSASFATLPRPASGLGVSNPRNCGEKSKIKITLPLSVLCDLGVSNSGNAGRRMAYGAMGIRTPDLLNAIEALYQLSYDPLPKPKQIAESVQCHNPLAKEIVLLAVPSLPSLHHDEPS